MKKFWKFFQCLSENCSHFLITIWIAWLRLTSSSLKSSSIIILSQEMILLITDSRFLLSEISYYIFLSLSSKDEYIKIVLSCFSWIMLIKDIMIKNYWDTDIIETEI